MTPRTLASGEATEEGVYTRWTYRKLPGVKFNGALWQGARLIWECDHRHGWQGAARECARGAAERWPGSSRVLNGPARVPSFRLPWAPDIRPKAVGL